MLANGISPPDAASLRGARYARQRVYENVTHGVLSNRRLRGPEQWTLGELCEYSAQVTGSKWYEPKL